ncbi:MAG: diguanylate cyclase [Betaproteobacteria bacterium]
MKILVVDDNDAVRSALRDNLAAEGYDIVLAKDGEEGLARARAERPGLVITDVLLPGVDGFQLLRSIREDDLLKDVPVIFYTGRYLDDEDKNLALRIGVSRYLIKPLDAADIITAVKEVVAEGALNRQHRGETGHLEEPVFLKAYNERLVSKLKRTMDENERVRLFLEHIMEGIGDGVMVIDRNYKILAANSAAAASVGEEKTRLTGRLCYEVTHKRQAPCESPGALCPHFLIFERGEPVVKVLHTHYSAQGDERHIEITASPVRDNEGRIFAVVETFRDIMEKYSDDELVKLVKRLNEAQTHLKHVAITDDLTGLRNRRYIIERLEEEFRRSKRTGDPLGLIMLDIDHFKQINDAHGHLFGDVVLRVISSRIKTSLRKHDIVGRVGGEEFLVICPESALKDTIIVAQRILTNINGEAIGDGIKEVRVALSAGATALNDNDISSEKLFSRADSALYKAKEDGRNRVVTL